MCSSTLATSILVASYAPFKFDSSYNCARSCFLAVFTGPDEHHTNYRPISSLFIPVSNSLSLRDVDSCLDTFEKLNELLLKMPHVHNVVLQVKDTFLNKQVTTPPFVKLIFEKAWVITLIAHHIRIHV